MTLRLVEGFDHYNTTALAAFKGWQSANNTGGSPFSWVAGRVNGQAMKITGVSSSSDISLKKFMPVTATTAVVGMAIRPQTFPMNRFAEIVTSTGAQIVMLALDAAGRLQIKNASSTVLATGTTPFVSGSWFYVEVKVVVNGATGSVTARVNAGPEIATTTINTGTVPVSGVSLRTIDVPPVSYDDLYIVDNAGSENNDFLGDRHVDTSYMTADGAHTDWVPNSGTAHFSRVNETNADLDTSYVASSALNAIDTYQAGPVSVVSADIRGIQVNLWARKDDAGLRQLAPVIRIAGVDYVGTPVTLATGYVDYTQIYEQNPATGADWTVTGVNTAEYGSKVVT